MGESDALKTPTKKNPYADGFAIDFDRIPKNKQPGTAPASPGESPVGNLKQPQAKKNPYADGFPIDYSQMDPRTAKNRPIPAPQAEIPGSGDRIPPKQEGMPVDFEVRMATCREANLGIPVDRNGHLTGQVLPGRDRDGYFIAVYYKEDPLSLYKHYHFGPNLQNIWINGVQHPVADYCKTANENMRVQNALDASEKAMHSNGLRPYDANSGLNKIDRWARSLTTDVCDPRVKAALTGALKSAETELIADVKNYPDEPVSKIRLAEILFAESFNNQDAQVQKDMQQNARQLLSAAAHLRRLNSTGQYDTSYIPVSPVAYDQAPYLEGGLVPPNYWTGAQSQAARVLSQFEQFFQESGNAALWSNTPKAPSYYEQSTFSTPPRPNNYNPNYGPTFGQPYQFAVPFINTRRQNSGYGY